MGVIGAIIVGFIAGIIAKLVTPGDPKPRGFVLTTVLGIVGAVLATYLGQAIGLYHSGETAGFVGAIVGAVIILIIWRQLARPR
ncbi:MAG: GlsB/YeaQ/YmgE family stress response membrane protein [Devosia sp.]|nr:GlsB/YeaQ/YmgE family stress response membrane protein [Devosia sp.]